MCVERVALAHELREAAEERDGHGVVQDRLTEHLESYFYK